MNFNVTLESQETTRGDCMETWRLQITRHEHNRCKSMQVPHGISTIMNDTQSRRSGKPSKGTQHIGRLNRTKRRFLHSRSTSHSQFNAIKAARMGTHCSLSLPHPKENTAVELRGWNSEPALCNLLRHYHIPETGIPILQQMTPGAQLP